MNQELKQLESDLRRIEQDMQKLAAQVPSEYRERLAKLDKLWMDFYSDARSFIWVAST